MKQELVEKVAETQNKNFIFYHNYDLATFKKKQYFWFCSSLSSERWHLLNAHYNS